MSLRLRLTLWYSALLTCLLLLIAIMAGSRVESSVVGGIDRELLTKGREIALLVEEGVQSGPMSSIILPTIQTTFGPETYVQIRLIDGRISHRSANLANRVIPFPDRFNQQARRGASGYYSLSFMRPDDFRVFFTPITFGNETIATLQIARNLAPEQAILRQFTSNLFGLIIVALALGAGGGYWLAGAALRPIQEATATALEITRTGRLDRRVPVRGQRNDEVGRLISTFNEMLDRLGELFERQRRFSADISHELRTPLTTILGNISLLKRPRGLPQEERDEMLAETEAEAQRMRRLVTDLLLLTQADADMTLSRERVELDTIFLEVYQQARRRATSIEVRILHEDQVVVWGDADRLRQMLINLVDNAIQYTPAGGRIELSLECLSNQAQITVSDTGQGITPEDLPHIFDRFYRADKARSRAAGGAGLGLSIVKWVVEAHHGEIDVSSTVGVGSAFHVRLPLAAGCDDQTAPAVKTTQA